MDKLKVADQWFYRRSLGGGITLLWEPRVHPLLRCNIWHIRGRDRDMLVDTGLGVSSLREAAADLFGCPLTVVATHSHNDHVGGMHEFAKDSCAIHKAEAEQLSTAADEMALSLTQLGDDFVRLFSSAGYQFDSELLISALPHEGFEPEKHMLQAVTPSYTLDVGDYIDLGNRNFEVLHLPGHSPGSIGLWEANTGTLFSGDAIYDGPLIDQLPESDRVAYAKTMERLIGLPVEQVLAGHGESFGREKQQEIARTYLANIDSDTLNTRR